MIIISIMIIIIIILIYCIIIIVILISSSGSSSSSNNNIVITISSSSMLTSVIVVISYILSLLYTIYGYYSIWRSITKPNLGSASEMANEWLPDRWHRNLKAFRERIQTHASSCFIAEWYVYTSLSLSLSPSIYIYIYIYTYVYIYYFYVSDSGGLETVHKSVARALCSDRRGGHTTTKTDVWMI